MRLFTACAESGDFIEEVKSIDEGVSLINRYEIDDLNDGLYTPDFYEVEDENHIRVYPEVI